MVSSKIFSFTLNKILILGLITIVGLASCRKDSINDGDKTNIANKKINDSNFAKSFFGKINDNYPIQMEIISRNGELSGKYFYTRVKKDIEIKGKLDDQGNIQIGEFDQNGNQTGIFKGKIMNNSVIEGTWSKPNGDNQMSFFLSENSDVYHPEQNNLTTGDISGIYSAYENHQLEVSEINSNTINVEISFATQSCMMGTHIGKLYKEEQNTYSGKIHSSDESDFNKYTSYLELSVEFSENKAIVKSKNALGVLGAPCWVDGSYSK